MSRAQRIYDNQTPESNHPEEPTDAEVDSWVSGDGADILVEMWQEECCQGGGYRDFVQWTEFYWDRIIELYVYESHFPEPDDYTSKDIDNEK